MQHRRLFTRVASTALLILGLVHPAPAQESYGTGQFACSRFDEHVIANVTTETGSGRRKEVVGQEGSLTILARDTLNGLLLEAWYDSLVVYREAAEGRIQPGTDGVIGGRFRGALTPDGRYTRRRVPFLPEDVGEVVNLVSALDDFFPRLAPVPLAVGESWSGSPRMRITRLPDSLSLGQSLRRYELKVTEADRPVPASDSTGIDVIQGEDHLGVYVWSADRGLLRWDREVAIRTVVPPGRDVRQAVRAKVVQHIVIERLRECAPPEQ
ncbi:MAG: hypothetical protein ABI613_05630 [Gemmatimonadota bacterium]